MLSVEYSRGVCFDLDTFIVNFTPSFLRDILAFMAERSAGKTTTPATAVHSAPPSNKPGNPFAGRPFILTRDAIQKQVFGMGYPSLPTMTVEGE